MAGFQPATPAPRARGAISSDTGVIQLGGVEVDQRDDLDVHLVEAAPLIDRRQIRGWQASGLADGLIDRNQGTCPS